MYALSVVGFLSFTDLVTHARELQVAFDTRSPDALSYVLDLTTDDRGIVWTGTESITFTNVDEEQMETVWIRLWGNGAKGCADPLAIQVSNVKGGRAGPLNVGCTALPVDLTTPLEAGQSAELSFDLKITAPDAPDRFGQIGHQIFLGNAIPLMAIRYGSEWNLQPYVSLGESFYSQDGDFTVTFHAPESLAIAATGEARLTQRSGGMATTTHTARNVRDFAWATGPFARLEGGSSTGVKVQVWWTNMFSKATAELVLDIVLQSLEFFQDRFGVYPYPELDVVLETLNFGMEYPQFILVPLSREVIVHEVAHQWWYGIVGNNQYAEPWLDEGFTSYATNLFFGVNTIPACDTTQWGTPDKSPVTNSVDRYTRWEEYSLDIYVRGACVLHNLERVLGRDRVERLLRSYVETYGLDFSTTARFVEFVQAEASVDPKVDLSRFWAEHGFMVPPRQSTPPDQPDSPADSPDQIGETPGNKLLLVGVALLAATTIFVVVVTCRRVPSRRRGP